MPTGGSLLLSNREHERPVKIECLNSRAACRRKTDQCDPLPGEVFRPNVAARVEYWNFVASVGSMAVSFPPFRSEQETQASARLSAAVIPPRVTGLT